MKEFNDTALMNMGCDVLTGERCAAGMRLLCDVDKAFVGVLSEFMGCGDLWNLLQLPWNYPANTRRSVMLTRDMLRSIWVYKNLCDGNHVMLDNNYVATHAVAPEEYDVLMGLDEYYKMKNWKHPWKRQAGVSVGGINIHQILKRG